MEKLSTLDWRGAFPEPKFRVHVEPMKHLLDATRSTSELKRQVNPVLKSVSNVLRATAVVSSVCTLVVAADHLITGGVGTAVAYSIPHSGDAVAVFATAVTKTASAGWDLFLEKVLFIVDYLMDGVIIFSGISWMFGNRTKAIELLLGGGVGYVIVRHHEDIKNFFALL